LTSRPRSTISRRGFFADGRFAHGRWVHELGSRGAHLLPDHGSGLHSQGARPHAALRRAPAGGTEAAATVELPGSWLQSVNQPDRAQWISPDNFSTVVFSLQPVTVDPARCPELAQRAAQDAQDKLDWVVVLSNEPIVFGSQWRRPKASDVKVTPTANPGVVDFELYVPGNVPGPSERSVFGRVMCKSGGLVQVACSTGHLKSDTIETCHQVIASATLEGVPPPPPLTPAPAPATPPAPSQM
jgi:hypothetical protein